jgi:L-2-hydroxycarboxylate dehydrogenase (NAD+)
LAIVIDERDLIPFIYYAMQALPQDMVGIAMTNAGRPSGADVWQRTTMWHESHLVCCACTKELPFVIDMATTTAAAGELELAARRGASIPLGGR